MGYLDTTGLAHFWAKIKTALNGKQDALEPDDTITMQDGGISVATPTRGIVSQAEFDALPEEQRNKGLYVIPGAGGCPGPGGEIYSTEETRIGTWIDGKPLYRKVLSLTLPSASGFFDLTPIDGQYQVIFIKGSNIGQENEILPFPYNFSGSEMFVPYIYKQNLRVCITHPSVYGCQCRLCIEYTKTTDKAVSE